jgi:hypothetical protein
VIYVYQKTKTYSHDSFNEDYDLQWELPSSQSQTPPKVTGKKSKFRKNMRKVHEY